MKKRVGKPGLARVIFLGKKLHLHVRYPNGNMPNEKLVDDIEKSVNNLRATYDHLQAFQKQAEDRRIELINLHAELLVVRNEIDTMRGMNDDMNWECTQKHGNVVSLGIACFILTLTTLTFLALWLSC